MRGYSNCIIFALILYRRRKLKNRRGFLVIRRSHWGPFPHVMFGRLRKNGEIAVVGFGPISPKPRWIPPPLFKGKVHWGDHPASKTRKE